MRTYTIACLASADAVVAGGVDPAVRNGGGLAGRNEQLRLPDRHPLHGRRLAERSLRCLQHCDGSHAGARCYNYSTQNNPNI